MPRWADEWMQVWYEMPMEFRLNKGLYRTFLRETLFTEAGIGEEAFGLDKVFTHRSFLSRIRKGSPAWLKQVLKPVLYPESRVNMNNMTALTSKMLERMHLDTRYSNPWNINKIEALWYFDILDKEFMRKHLHELLTLLEN